MSKRKEITKKMRFEVLKRDRFRCQYCGREAPDVVLNVDHIKPLSKGGTNEITNLITSCFDCNSGKSDIELSDDSAIKIKRRQIEELADRREQMEMMLQWEQELTKEMIDGADVVASIIEQMSGYEVYERGMRELRKLTMDFGVPAMCDAARIAFSQYDTSDQRGFEYAFSKLGGIAYNRSRESHVGA